MIKEGWPLLTVKTEANGDSKSTNEGVLPWLLVGLFKSVQEIFVPSARNKIIFSSLYTNKEIQKGTVAKSYMTNGLLIND
jgi:hypothetical protein